MDCLILRLAIETKYSANPFPFKLAVIWLSADHDALQNVAGDAGGLGKKRRRAPGRSREG